MKTPTYSVSPSPYVGMGKNVIGVIAHKGFTLLELLVVIAVAALLVSVVPASISKLHEASQYRDTVRSILVDLRQAHVQAMMRGKSVTFSVDLQNRVYGIVGITQRKIPDSLELRTTTADDLSLKTAKSDIVFFPEGGSTGGSLLLLRQSGAGVRIKVDWLLGQVAQESSEP